MPKSDNPYQDICNQYNKEKLKEEKMAHCETLTDFESYLIMRLIEEQVKKTGCNCHE